jgi:hypothetical protein
VAGQGQARGQARLAGELLTGRGTVESAS